MRKFALLLVCAAAAMHAQDPDVLANIDEAFRLAGVTAILESMPSHVNEMTSAAVAQFPKEQRQQFEPVIKDVSSKFLAPDVFYRQLRTYFVKHYDAGHMNTFLALERTPVYRTMHRLEESARSPAGQASLRRFAANLKSDPPTPKRVAIMQQMDAAGNTTGMQVRMVVSIVNAISGGLGAQLPPDLEAQSTAFTAKIRPLLSNNVLIANLFTYRNSDDAEVEDYVAAARQADVEWFNKNLQAAILAAAVDQSTKAGEAIKVKTALVQPLN